MQAPAFVAAGTLQQEQQQEQRSSASSASSASSSSSSSSSTAAAAAAASRTTPSSSSSSSSSARKPKKAKRGRRKSSRSTHASSSALDREFGQFEKYTKGVGSKLLRKMGFKGRLGKREQGISVPIIPNVRQNARAGLSYGGRTEISESMRRAEKELHGKDPLESSSDSSEDDEAAAAPGPRNQWQRSAPKKPKRVYKTAAELAREATDLETGASDVIVDMRGPTAQRTTLGALSSGKREREDVPFVATKLPELQHNLRLLVDMARGEILTIEGRRRKTLARVAELEQQRLAGQERVERVAKHATAAEAAQAAVSRAIDDFKTSPRGVPRLLKLADAMIQLRGKFPQQYSNFRVAHIALRAAWPDLQQLVRQWQPLSTTAPLQPLLPVLAPWRAVLEGEEFVASTSSPHFKFLDELVIPRLTLACGQWDPKVDQLGMLSLLDALTEHTGSALPEQVKDAVLADVVLPRLEEALRRWDARRDTLPLHVWVHPFLPHLSTRDRGSVIDAVRRKLASVLSAWNALDTSAHKVLKPWATVFGAHVWAAFIDQTIVPKLHQALRDFAVEPAAQDLTALQAVLLWHDVLPSEAMMAVLLEHFFPRWLEALYAWLKTGTADMKEVSKWYTGWKSVFPSPVQGNEVFKTMFSRGLALMQAAMKKQPLDALMQRIRLRLQSDVEAATAVSRARAAEARSAKAPAKSRPASLTFREAVSKYASQHGITFAPTGRQFQAKQVYSFGARLVVLDRGAIFELVRGEAVPVSLEELVG